MVRGWPWFGCLCDFKFLIIVLWCGWGVNRLVSPVLCSCAKMLKTKAHTLFLSHTHFPHKSKDPIFLQCRNFQKSAGFLLSWVKCGWAFGSEKRVSSLLQTNQKKPKQTKQETRTVAFSVNGLLITEYCLYDCSSHTHTHTENEAKAVVFSHVSSC